MPSRLSRSSFVPLALALVGLLSGCGRKPADTGSAPAPDAAPGTLDVTADGRSLIALAVTEVKPQRFTVAVSAPGTVRSDQDKTALVGPVVEGQISQVLVGWGEAVQRGQVLAVLDSAAAGEAKAAHLRARAELQVADSTFKRMQALATGKIVATKDLTAAEADRTSAQAEADAAEKALRLMGFTADDVAHITETHDLTSQMQLVAPVAGTIVDRTAVVGAWAGPGTTLFTIMDLGSVWVDAQVYEKDLGSLKPGEPVTVAVVAYPDRTFGGQVSYIGSTVDESTRTTIVRTVVANPDRLLKPGMFATVRVVTRDSPDTLLLPEGAVLQSPGQWQVVVEEGGHYRLRDVQVGTTSGGQSEIVGGLRPGEHVVTSGQNQIAAALAAPAGSN